MMGSGCDQLFAGCDFAVIRRLQLIPQVSSLRFCRYF
jgi:hypothetical protein